uniref:Reverse transcriptase domain-containing protein n=1 Tax=Cajanus cajan TaxID=3821 RepID=A0A151U948_CAJCA|nr:hypothetical protein KK1_019969 [Cajanus cajan]
MRMATSKGKFVGYQVGEKKVPVSLLQYADDTIFIGEATMENVITVKCLMRSFELTSGLKVNFHKSSVGILGVNNSLTERYADLLNCKSLHFPFSYLGLPIGASARSSVTWKPVLQKIKDKLANWKHRMPTLVHKKLIAIQRRFLWGMDEGTKKICWVKWEMITSPKIL